MKVKNHYYEIILSGQKDSAEVDMVEGEQIIMLLLLPKDKRPKFINTSDGVVNTAFIIQVKKCGKDWKDIIELTGEAEKIHQKFIERFGDDNKLLDNGTGNKTITSGA